MDPRSIEFQEVEHPGNALNHGDDLPVVRSFLVKDGDEESHGKPDAEVMDEVKCREKSVFDVEAFDKGQKVELGFRSELDAAEGDDDEKEEDGCVHDRNGKT